MAYKTLEIKTSICIQKSADVVYEAIIDPKKMSNYFIESSTGLMKAGKTIIWKFPEFETKFPVRIDKIKKNNYISYYWNDVDGTPTLVEMTLTKKSNKNTLVVVTEKSRKNDEAGLKWLKGNTEGWANFLACLKAYIEFGINLRKGCFDHAKLAKEFKVKNTIKRSNK